MVFTLECTVCGSPTRADAGALRSGFTSCPSCGTFHRVTEDGITAAPSDEQLKAVPDGVKVDQSGESLSMTARVSASAPAAHGRELFAGAVGAIATGYGVAQTSAPWFLVPIGGFATFVVTIMLVAKLRKFPPPVRLTRHALQSGVRLTKIPRGDVKQVYTTEFNPNMGALGAQLAEMEKQQAKHQPVFWVCAIRSDGSRVQLLGPLVDLQHAMYVEERLEAALGLADRKVVGQLVDDRKQPLEVGAEGDQVCCKGCGADQKIDEESRRRGFVLCKYCRTAAVVASGNALGQALGARKAPQFSVSQGDCLVVSKVGGDELLTVHLDGSLETSNATYSDGALGQLTVRIAGQPSIKAMLGAVGKMGDLTAYTARRSEDAAAMVSEMLDMKFRIAAGRARDEVVLIDNIDDPREAFELLAKLEAFTNQVR